MKQAIIGMVLVVTGCQTTAPSNYELNRRSGISVALDDKDQGSEQSIDDDLTKFRTSNSLPKSIRKPVRLPGVVEPIYYYGGKLNGKHWMQSTWLYVEVDSEKWLGELDDTSGKWFERDAEKGKSK
jgi:hypothetical protein